MPRVDYQAAWTALQAHAASKTSHGREDLLVTMAELAEEHTVPEDLLERAGRLLGGGVTYTAESPPASSGDRDEIDERMVSESPSTDDPQGGHDGREKRGRSGRSPDPVRS